MPRRSKRMKRSAESLSDSSSRTRDINMTVHNSSEEVLGQPEGVAETVASNNIQETGNGNGDNTETLRSRNENQNLGGTMQSRYMFYAYNPKHLDEELGILFEDDLAALNRDALRVFPKNLQDYPKFLTALLISDENTADGLGLNQLQVNLIDNELVPALFAGENFAGVGIFVLNFELLLEKTCSEQIAIVNEEVGNVCQFVAERNQRAAIYIPRLERFCNTIQTSIYNLMAEKLLLTARKPVLIVATTGLTFDTLPDETFRIFMGPGSAKHTIASPSPEKINMVMQRVLPNHKIFIIKDNQSETVATLLHAVKTENLPEICEHAVRVCSEKSVSDIMTVYQALKFYCDIHGGNWEKQANLVTSMSFLINRLRMAIDGI